MTLSMEERIAQIALDVMKDLNRPDLFRAPLVSFSSARDERYARLKTIIGEWHQLPTELLPEARSVVSYFVPFTKEVVSQPRGMKDGSPLWSEAYQEVNRRFNAVNEAVAAYLEDEGFKSVSIRSTHTYDPADMKCFWPW